MAYGDRKDSPYTSGATPNYALASRDLGRAASGDGLPPYVQEVTHEVSGTLDGKQQVTTPGVRVQLVGSTTKVVFVFIEALGTNLDNVVVGGATVVAAPGTHGSPTLRGVELAPREGVSFTIHDLATVYLDANQALDGVSWFALT